VGLKVYSGRIRSLNFYPRWLEALTVDPGRLGALDVYGTQRQISALFVPITTWVSSADNVPQSTFSQHEKNVKLHFVGHSTPYYTLHSIHQCSKLASSNHSEQSPARRFMNHSEYCVNVTKSILSYLIQIFRRGHWIIQLYTKRKQQDRFVPPLFCLDWVSGFRNKENNIREMYWTLTEVLILKSTWEGVNTIRSNKMFQFQKTLNKKKV
jgi:hypothetical protein